MSNLSLNVYSDAGFQKNTKRVTGGVLMLIPGQGIYEAYAVNFGKTNCQDAYNAEILMIAVALNLAPPNSVIKIFNDSVNAVRAAKRLYDGFPVGPYIHDTSRTLFNQAANTQQEIKRFAWQSREAKRMLVADGLARFASFYDEGIHTVGVTKRDDLWNLEP